MIIRYLLPVVALVVVILPWGNGGREPWALAVAAFAVVLALFFVWRSQTNHTSASRPLALATYLLLFWGVLSLAWSVNQFDSKFWLIQMLLGIVIFHVAAQLGREQKAWLLTIYTWIAAAAAIVGIYYLAFNSVVPEVIQRGALAVFILPASLLALSQIGRVGKFRNYALNTFFITYLIWSSAWPLLIITSVAGYFLIGKKEGGSRKSTKILLILLSSILVYFASYFCAHILFKSSVNLDSLNQDKGSAFSAWPGAIEAWWEQPVGGDGAGTFRTIAPEHQKSVLDQSLSANSLVLQTAAELGFVGAFILIWVIFLASFGVVRGIIVEPAFRVVVFGFFGLLISFMLTSAYTFSAILWLAFVLAGIAYPSRKRPLNLRRRLSLCLALLLVVALSVSYLQSDTFANRAKVEQDNGNFQDSAKLYASAHTGLMYDPDNWRNEGISFYILGLTEKNQRFFSLAEDRAAMGIALDSKDSKNYLLKGRAELRQGKIREAIEDLNHPLHHDQYNHPEYYVDLSMAFWEARNYQNAYAVALRGTEVFTEDVISQRTFESDVRYYAAELWLIRAKYHQRIGQPDIAKDEANHAAQIDPRRKTNPQPN